MQNLYDLGAVVFIAFPRTGLELKTRVTAVWADRKGRIRYDYTGRGENELVTEDRVSLESAKPSLAESAPADVLPSLDPAAAPALDDPARIDAMAEELTATGDEPAKESLAKKTKAKR